MITEKLLQILLDEGIIFYNNKNQLTYKNNLRKKFNINNLDEIIPLLENKFGEFRAYLKAFPEKHRNPTEILYCIYNNMLEPHRCEDCGENFTHFINKKLGYYKVCKPCTDKKVADKVKESCLKKYGVSNPMLVPEFKEKLKETNLKRFGCAVSTQNPDIKEKIRKRNIEKYGYPSYNQLPEAKEKMRNYFLNKFGCTSPLINEEIRKKTAETCKIKYGVNSAMEAGALPEFREKARKTLFDRYNCFIPMQNPDILEKVRQTNLKRYGVPSVAQNPEIKRKSKAKYYFNNIYFDSIPELVFYIKHQKDSGFIFKPDGIKYFVEKDNSYHVYFPDFKIGDQLIEIKGPHMIDKEGHLVDFYEKGKNQYILNEKEKCMKENNVLLIISTELNPLINQIKKERGSKFFEECKENAIKINKK